MKTPIQNFCDVLSELDLIDQYGRQILQSLGANIIDERVSEKTVINVKPFYNAIANTYICEDSIMAIAEENLSCYAASTVGYDIEDLSVYDILRYRLLLSDNDKYLVVNGALSGIQKFLFDVKSSAARKQLTGRSFYLSLLIDSVLERILRDFGASRQSVLYSSGGTFSLLLPYGQKVERKLITLITEIKAQVYLTHQEQLVLLNYIVAARKDLEHDPSSIFATLQEYKNRDKYSPLAVLAQDEYNHFFQPTTISEPAIIDVMGNLGAALGQMKGILVSSQVVTDNKVVFSVEPGGLGIYYNLLTEVESVNSHVDVSNSMLIVFNDKPKHCIKCPWRLEYMAGFGEQLLSFEELLEKSQGVRRLGVLRMDVDNLGSTLRKTYKQQLPLARFAYKSRQLDKFFKQAIHQIWLREFKDSVVVVYSGGDDLFIVGSWVKILEFSENINQQFVKTFCGDQISLSAGISFVEAKFPIIRAAELSANEESIAKQFIFVDAMGIAHPKQAISMFNTALRWNAEFNKVNEICKKWEDLMSIKADKDNVLKTLLRRLLNYNANVTYNDRKISPIRQIWLITYDLARLKQRYENVLSKEESAFIENCKEDIITGNTILGSIIDSPYHSLKLWAIAARLVELKTRNN